MMDNSSNANQKMSTKKEREKEWVNNLHDVLIPLWRKGIERKYLNMNVLMFLSGIISNNYLISSIFWSNSSLDR